MVLLIERWGEQRSRVLGFTTLQVGCVRRIRVYEFVILTILYHVLFYLIIQISNFVD